MIHTTEVDIGFHLNEECYKKDNPVLNLILGRNYHNNLDYIKYRVLMYFLWKISWWNIKKYSFPRKLLIFYLTKNHIQPWNGYPCKTPLPYVPMTFTSAMQYHGSNILCMILHFIWMFLSNSSLYHIKCHVRAII